MRVLVVCNLKMTYGDGDFVTLSFCPAEWDETARHVDLRMTVDGTTGDQFAPGQVYAMELTREP